MYIRARFTVDVYYAYIYVKLQRYVYVELCLYVWPSQPGKVANPARGQQLNRKLNYSLSSFAPENLVSRDGLGGPISRQLAHLHTPG